VLVPAQHSMARFRVETEVLHGEFKYVACSTHRWLEDERFVLPRGTLRKIYITLEFLGVLENGVYHRSPVTTGAEKFPDWVTES
jgi:hypothetical protein